MTNTSADTARTGSSSTQRDKSNSADGSARLFGLRIPFYYGWVVLVVAALGVYASAPGQTYTFSVFLESIQADLGISDTVTSSLYMGASLFAAFMVIVIGRAYDALGVRVVLPAVGLLLGVSALWMSQVTSVLGLLVAFALLRTFGQGALSMVPATLVSTWFIRKRGKSLALMMLGAALASGTFPSIANGLVGSLGWREAWVAIAFVPWVLVIVPAILLVRPSPESMGLQPDGASQGEKERQEAADREQSFTLREAMRGRSMWLLMLAGSAQAAIGTSLMFHQVSLLGERGVSNDAAAAMFGVIAPTMLVGQFVSGFLADRYPLRFMVAIGQGLLFVAISLVFFVSSAWQATGYALVLGFSVGFLMNSMLAVWPAYYGRAHLGSIKGMGQWAMMAAAAVGPLPLALSRDLTDSFTTGLVVLAVMPIVCGVAALAATKPARMAPGRPA